MARGTASWHEHWANVLWASNGNHARRHHTAPEDLGVMCDAGLTAYRGERS
jgi:hypothetical protein